MLEEIHQAISKYLESLHIQKQSRVKEHVSFNQCTMMPTTYEQYQDCEDKAIEEIKVKVPIQVSKPQLLRRTSYPLLCNLFNTLNLRTVMAAIMIVEVR